MSLDKSLEKILIIDFGSQFTQLIARRIREIGVFSEIVSHKKIKNKDIIDTVKGIILSGWPLNVYIYDVEIQSALDASALKEYPLLTKRQKAILMDTKIVAQVN